LVLTLSVAVVPFAYRTNFSLSKVDPIGFLVLTILAGITSWVGKNRRRTEAELREDNEVLDARVRAATADLEHRVAELETLYSQLSIGLCHADQQGKIIRINRALTSMTGVLSSAETGAPLSAVFQSELAEVIGGLIVRVRETGESVVNFEVESGDHVWSLSCSPVRREGEPSSPALLGFQVAVQDITLRKRDERALQKANEDLRRANEDLSQFTYIAAHDLQEPLRNVMLFSELVQEDAQKALDSRLTNYLEFIAENARRMRQLIADVVSYSFVSSANERKMVMVDLNEVCRMATVRNESDIRRTGAQVTFADLPQVMGDPEQLTQVFAHLFSNAIKFQHPSREPRIAISASIPPGERSWQVTVQDNGQGFDKEYGESIFGMLKRLHGREVPGSGIGLAICKAVIEGHGGRIWMDSAEGQGTTVHLTLAPYAKSRELRIA
jgi:PAS domain S-box-containing protein